MVLNKQTFWPDDGSRGKVYSDGYIHSNPFNSCQDIIKNEPTDTDQWRRIVTTVSGHTHTHTHTHTEYVVLLLRFSSTTLRVTDVLMPQTPRCTRYAGISVSLRATTVLCNSNTEQHTAFSGLWRKLLKWMTLQPDVTNDHSSCSVSQTGRTGRRNRPDHFFCKSWQQFLQKKSHSCSLSLFLLRS